MSARVVSARQAGCALRNIKVTSKVREWSAGRAKRLGIIAALLLTAVLTVLAVAWARSSWATAVPAESSGLTLGRPGREAGAAAERGTIVPAPVAGCGFWESRSGGSAEDVAGAQDIGTAGAVDGDREARETPFAGTAPATAQSPVNDPAIGQGAGFLDWFERDVKYLRTLGQTLGALSGRGYAGLDDRAVLLSRISCEIARLREAIAYLDERPSYRDPDLGFSVYDTQATGWLHVLDVALRTREDLLSALRSPLTGWLSAARERAVCDAAAQEAASLYRLSDGTPLYDADPSRLPQVDEVVRTLRAMDLPRPAFDGYRVYLLPLSMGDVSGLGAEGYTLIGAAAAGREVIANQVAVTVAHEFGHHIQLSALGPTYAANPTTWSRYMSLRGIRGWAADGKVNTEAWASSPEETFAEDVRVLFGPPEASREPFGTAYADPRSDPELAAKAREFIAAQAAAVRSGDSGTPFGGGALAGGASGDIGSSLAIVKALLRSCYERIAAGP